MNTNIRDLAAEVIAAAPRDSRVTDEELIVLFVQVVDKVTSASIRRIKGLGEIINIIRSLGLEDITAVTSDLDLKLRENEEADALVTQLKAAIKKHRYSLWRHLFL